MRCIALALRAIVIRGQQLLSNPLVGYVTAPRLEGCSFNSTNPPGEMSSQTWAMSWKDTLEITRVIPLQKESSSVSAGLLSTFTRNYHRLRAQPLSSIHVLVMAPHRQGVRGLFSKPEVFKQHKCGSIVHAHWQIITTPFVPSSVDVPGAED